VKNLKISLLTPFGPSAIIALAVAWGMQPEASGLGAWYERYAGWIRGGFASGDAGEAQTFPMWGYGWLLALVPWPAVLVVGQIFTTVGGTALLLRALVDTGRITQVQAVVGAWTLAMYLPWYAGMTAAYSAPAFAMGFLLITLALLIYWIGNPNAVFSIVLAAALSFGVTLNFRSDYYAFTPVVAVLLFFGAVGWRRGLAAAGIWLGCVLLLLSPWLAYTHAATGRASLTSTNSGHVLFLSWGDLPANPWGIRVNDGDPVMAGELRARFGRPVSSLGAEGDQFLRERFLVMVGEQPGLYVRRLMQHAVNLALGGFYPGLWDPGFREQVHARFPDGVWRAARALLRCAGATPLRCSCWPASATSWRFRWRLTISGLPSTTKSPRWSASPSGGGSNAGRWLAAGRRPMP